MLHPSYTDLMGLINDRSGEEQDKVKSRYSVIIATSKRARELIEGDEPLVKLSSPKHLSIAIEELYQGKIDIV
jgi:DNA-directed RNA polymerase subunit omega